MAGTGGEKTRRIRNILVLVGALVAAGFALYGWSEKETPPGA